MTRKRFWGLRNALSVRLHEWAISQGLDSHHSDSKKMRPVSGKPLVTFGEFGSSYEECWNCEPMKQIRKTIGM